MDNEHKGPAKPGKKPKNVERERLAELAQKGTPQDVTSVRAKSEKHGKMTADKWNQ